MNTQKRNRLIAAVTVNVVLLLVILIGVLIYQLVTISVLDKRKQDLQSEINKYADQTEIAKDSFEYYQSYEGKVSLVIENYEELISGDYTYTGSGK